jgi:DNA mismatch repair protein MutS
MTKIEKTKTPLMDQYLKIKSKYSDAILLYRMGDFYETFYDDAKLISKLLGIALTKRAHGKSADVPLAGFPYHALDNYLHKLVGAGHRVAICEQVEDPKLAKGIVKREVIEIVTPGATLSDKLLDTNKNNFLAAIFIEDDQIGLALSDVSTGEFHVCESRMDQAYDQLISFYPREILINTSQENQIDFIRRHLPETTITKRDEWIYTSEFGREKLINHFNVHSLKGFGLEDLNLGVIAAGAVIQYLQENYKSSLGHIKNIRTINVSDYMILDDSTRRNLEIYSPLRENIGGNTLLDVLDKTQTPMGGRLIRIWLNQPLQKLEIINERLSLVSDLAGGNQLRKDIRNILYEISDMERLIGKIATGRANGRDLNSLKNSLDIIPRLNKVISGSKTNFLQKHFEKMTELPEIVDLISNAISENPPQTITEGGVIKKGYNKELDELTDIAHHGKEWLTTLQEKERVRTGISTLKINFNRVFGYYIEVSKIHSEKIPDDYLRKQTLVNAERYITPELKEKEEKILGAEDKIKVLEYEIFQEVRNTISRHTGKIQENSQLISYLDVISSLAEVACENNYVRPEINDSRILEISNGRHPVVEHFMKPGEEFIANNVFLFPETEQIWIITGPNMAGKSTFLRQVGLIVFMAQIGSFVPASKAKIGLVDRIFTRVGASDNLASGESTFLVEMNETANILHNATDRSLVLLDEIGRGTSTFDGLSIAWAVAEYLNKEEKLHAKTLFATHYHELTELSFLYPKIKNYNIAVEELESEIIFLRKIIPGGTDNSYGIHVAQMAGLPYPVIERAREILTNLEANELTPNRTPKLAQRQSGRDVDKSQLALFEIPKPSEVERNLKDLDINKLTPLDALLKLDELKKMINKK